MFDLLRELLMEKLTSIKGDSLESFMDNFIKSFITYQDGDVLSINGKPVEFTTIEDFISAIINKVNIETVEWDGIPVGFCKFGIEPENSFNEYDTYTLFHVSSEYYNKLSNNKNFFDTMSREMYSGESLTQGFLNNNDAVAIFVV